MISSLLFLCSSREVLSRRMNLWACLCALLANLLHVCVSALGKEKCCKLVLPCKNKITLAIKSTQWVWENFTGELQGESCSCDWFGLGLSIYIQLVSLGFLCMEKEWSTTKRFCHVSGTLCSRFTEGCILICFVFLTGWILFGKLVEMTYYY